MAVSRFLVCLVVVAWSCVALLAPLVQARVGLVSGLGGNERPAPVTFLHVTGPKQQQQQQRHGVASGRAAPSWSAAPARGRDQLRSVPAGPDPLHHHGSPRRPEQEQKRVP